MGPDDVYDGIWRSEKEEIDTHGSSQRTDLHVVDARDIDTPDVPPRYEAGFGQAGLEDAVRCEPC